MHGLTAFLVIAAALVVGLSVQGWIARNFEYKCPNCGNRFSLSLFAGALSPHAMGRKWVRCPRCGKRSWVYPVPKGSGPFDGS